MIVGGGVSGLSAARQLMHDGQQDFVLLELEQNTGGNASYGKNEVSAYPLGAHYIPIPNNELKEYLDFLQECDVIIDYDKQGLPVYNELFLCHDPEERLYLNGAWQDGLVPRYGVSDAEREEFVKFFSLMDHFRALKGEDGKDVFAIPVDTSARSETARALDQITMKEWMEQENLHGNHLRWYVDYCTRDDFGTRYDQISAWAGIHYFAARKGKGANAAYHDVLTWEEGNGFLVRQLQKKSADQIRSNALVVSIEYSGDDVRVQYLDTQTGKIGGIRAGHCIIAAPQFVAARLLKEENRSMLVRQHLHYVPWMVANLTVNDMLSERSGSPASWDNVIYGGKGLGYVDATHQQLQQHKGKRNLTYYYPLTDADPLTERKAAQKRTYEEWVAHVISDLKLVHPNIEQATERMDISLWGHAMAQPLPGWIHGSERQELGKSLHGRIHFAHTDLAGISIFEEAFYQGVHAARKAASS
ncbi:MAG: FAD-dependent oxidoreductase [Chitinophagaceae bacterium]|nr:FAD-dependent oxidoreductase [Chitinophagaceae bacterium]